MNGIIINDKSGVLLDIAWPRADGTYDLSSADLREADLSSANLFSADLSRANLSSASLIDLGQDSRGYRFVACAGEPYMIAAGCRWLALAEAKAHWKNNAEARLKIELCEKEAKRRGWVK